MSRRRSSSDGLTPAQSRILEEVRRAGEWTYDGRAMKPTAALERYGLITRTIDDGQAFNAHGGISRWTRITCWPVEQTAEARTDASRVARGLEPVYGTTRPETVARKATPEEKAKRRAKLVREAKKDATKLSIAERACVSREVVPHLTGKALAAWVETGDRTDAVLADQQPEAVAGSTTMSAPQIQNLRKQSS